MHRLQPLRPRKEHEHRNHRDDKVAHEELVEVRTLLLDDAPTRLPCWYLSLAGPGLWSGRWDAIVVRWEMTVCGRRWSVARVRGGQGTVHQPAVAEWLAEGLVQLGAQTSVSIPVGATHGLTASSGHCSHVPKGRQTRSVSLPSVCPKAIYTSDSIGILKMQSEIYNMCIFCKLTMLPISASCYMLVRRGARPVMVLDKVAIWLRLCASRSCC